MNRLFITLYEKLFLQTFDELHKMVVSKTAASKLTSSLVWSRGLASDEQHSPTNKCESIRHRDQLRQHETSWLTQHLCNDWTRNTCVVVKRLRIEANMQEIAVQKPSVKELLYTGKIQFP